MKVRALNSDNAQDMEKLTQLFSRHYPESYPLKRIFDTSFWVTNDCDQELDGFEIMHLAVEDESQLLAHLGVRRTFQNGSRQILLPATIESSGENGLSLIKPIADEVMRLAEKQGWPAVSQTVLPDFTFDALVAEECFHMQPVAIVPFGKQWYGYTEESDSDSSHDQCSIIMSALLRYDRYNQRRYYPPLAHNDFTKDLYSLLGAKDLLLDDESGEDTPLEAHRPLRINFLQRFDLYLFSIIPSCLDDWGRVKELFIRFEHSRKREERNFGIQIALEDPRTPEFCEKLDALGYRYSGIFPSRDTYDYVIYTKFNQSEEPSLEKMSISLQEFARYFYGT